MNDQDQWRTPHPEVEQAIAEVNKVIERMIETPVATIVEKTTVVTTDGGYQAHPESYSPRVFVYVKATEIHYELLRTGEAVSWVTKSPEGFDFWIMDVARLSDVGVYRANPGIEPHVQHQEQ